MDIDKTELLKRLIIADASFLTAKEKILLSKKLDSPYDLAIMSNIELSSIIQRDLSRSTWNEKQVLKKAETALVLINNFNINYTFAGDSDFPVMLTEMKDPPYVIFYRGNLQCLKQTCVSVVGTRRASPSGRKAAFEFSRDASAAGTTVVSGLAFGIDVYSHKGAVDVPGGKTCAVLPSGIDTITPLSHTKVAASILENDGVILSEYVPGTPAVNFRFVQRNRIIAALSPATVVIQAPAGSGAMITASLALDYNRYLFFHQACFDDSGRALAKAVEMELSNEALKGKVSDNKVKSKLLNSPARYVEDGAPVISGWKDYLEQRTADFAGINIIKNNGQMELFD